jgi:hypothetical protein
VGVSLKDVQRIAADVARQQDDRLEIVAAIPAEGSTAYTEVVLTIRGCRGRAVPDDDRYQPRRV